MRDLLNLVGALVTAGLGVMGLVAPRSVHRITQLEAPTPSAFGEFRATYGGLFVGLGVAAIVWGTPEAFAIVGVGWLAIAGGRLVSVVADPGGRHPRNVGALAFESAVGLLLVL